MTLVQLYEREKHTKQADIRGRYEGPWLSESTNILLSIVVSFEIRAK